MPGVFKSFKLVLPFILNLHCPRVAAHGQPSAHLSPLWEQLPSVEPMPDFSLASQLPQVQRSFLAQRRTCGSWLASEEANSVFDQCLACTRLNAISTNA
jgi:hypothetical protein